MCPADERKLERFRSLAEGIHFKLTKVLSAGADLGQGPGARPPPPLFWMKKEEITEGGKADRERKTRPSPFCLRLLKLTGLSSVPGSRVTLPETFRL